MNLILVFIIIGVCIMHFGFWATVGGFFMGLVWLVVVVLIIAGAVWGIITALDNLG